MEVSFPKIGSVALAILSFIKISTGTLFEDFLRWALLGGFVDFVNSNYNMLASSCIAIIFLKWVKNIYALGIIWVMIYLILVFVF